MNPISDLCCCRGRHFFTPCSRSPPPVSHSLLRSSLLLCLEIVHVPIRPPSTPDPRTMGPSGRCHATSLPGTQHVSQSSTFVARSQCIYMIPLYAGFYHASLTDLLGLSQDHQCHPPFSRMDDLRVTTTICDGGSVAGTTSAQRAPESVCGYCTFLYYLSLFRE